MRAWMLRLHLWLGLGAGLLLAISGLSGAILILRPSLEARAVPAMNVTPRESKASWQAIYRNARKAARGEKVEHIFVSRQANRAHEIWLRKGETLLYVDPYTAQVLGERQPQRDFWGWMSGLHIRLLSGERGHAIIGWGGLALVALGLSGLVLWWPRGDKKRASTWKRAVTMKWAASLRVRTFEWHRVIGFASSLLFLLIGSSGAALVWPEAASSTFARILGQSTAPKPKAKGAGAWRSLDEMVRTAGARFPEGQLMRLSFPAKAGAPLSIRFKLPSEMHPNGMNTVFLDAARGEVLSVQDTRRAPADQRAMFLRYPLHTGEWGGLFSKILAVLAGLMLPGLWISGVLLWAWKKRKPRRSARARSPEAAEAGSSASST